MSALPVGGKGKSLELRSHGGGNGAGPRVENRGHRSHCFLKAGGLDRGALDSGKNLYYSGWKKLGR